MTRAAKTQPLLSIDQLGVQIGSTQVCHDLSVKIQSGECWGLLGANGIGKTTLLHTLAGLLASTHGAIHLSGKDLSSMSRREVSKIRGVLFQTEDKVFPGTVLEQVLIGRSPHLGHWGWETAHDLQLAEQALHEVGLKELAHRKVDSLSGGERRRMDIATLLAQQPRLALLDEPSNHLDLGQQIQMLNRLKQTFTRQGHALVMVLHDINLASRYCDRLLLLTGDGNWLAGNTAEIATAENMQMLYGHPLLTVAGPNGQILIPA